MIGESLIVLIRQAMRKSMGRDVTQTSDGNIFFLLKIVSSTKNTRNMQFKTLSRRREGQLRKAYIGTLLTTRSDTSTDLKLIYRGIMTN